MQRRTAGTRRSRRGDGAGAQSGSTLIEEREGDLRCGARVVEPSDTKVEAGRSALRLSRIQSNDRWRDGERGLPGRVTEFDGEHRERNAHPSRPARAIKTEFERCDP